jgi:putative PEP-CTERM system TPR-repeat lipoprotein
MRAIQLQILIPAALVMLTLAGCGGGQARYASHMERGQRYLAEGNLDKASVEFRNALQIQPKAAEALYLNGRVAEQRGNVSEAVGLYQAAIDAKPDYDRARASLGKAYVFGGAPRQAMEIIGPGLLAHPDDPDLLAARAAARHQLKDDVEARADAELAAKLAPANENAVAVLAALYQQAGESARAVSLVSDAVAKIPSSVDLRRVLASLYLSTGQPDNAEEQMRKIIELQPRDLGPRSQLAVHFARAHKLDEAQRVLEDAVRDLPQKDQAKLTLVDFIATQRSRAQGEKILRDFIAREPDDLDLRLGLAVLLQRTGAVQAAVATYNDVMGRAGTGPKGLIARDRVAAVEISQRQYERAQKLIAEVLQKSPRDNDALIMRADIALERNDPTAAIVDLRTVLRDQPKSVPLQRTLARAYLAKGEPVLAEEALRAAMDAAPDDATTKIELAQFLTQTERTSQAVTLLEETVHRAPNNPEAREALVRAYIENRDLPAARIAAEDLKTLRPDSAAGFNLAGLIAYDEKRLDDSQKNLEHALALQPGSIDILTSLTRLDLARGRSAAAIGRLQAVVDRDPRNVQLLNLLGELYLETRDLGHATETLIRATELDPRSWMSYRDLALVKVAANDTNGAIGLYETASKIAPGEPQLLTELASLYEKQGRIDDAIARYDALYKSSPGVQQLAANNLAMLLVAHKTDQASLDRARDLTSGFVTSGNGALLDTNGWVHFKRREYRDAVAVLERAAERSPDSKVIRYHLGMVQLQLGQRERARTNLEAALAGSATFTGSEEARSALASLQGRSG